MRCFVALDFGDDTRERLRVACEELRRRAPGWSGEKWVRPDNQHITLAFLGDIGQPAAELIAEGLGALAESTPAFRMPFSGITAVPGIGRASMLWAEFHDTEEAGARLAAAVGTLARGTGVEVDRRPWRSHATLVRARRPRSAPSREVLSVAEDVLSEAMSDPCVTLYSSRLTPRGPIYSVVGTWRLRGE